MLGPVTGRAAVPDDGHAVVPRPRLLQVDDDHLGVVRGAGDPRGVARVVVVVADEDAPVPQAQHRLERLHRQGVRLAEAVALPRVDAARVLHAQGVEHELLADVPVPVRLAQVDLVDALGDRRRALEVVALDDPERVLADGERVPEDVRLLVGLVVPGAARVLAPAGVELVDHAPALVRVADEGALEHGVQVPAGAGHRLEAPAGADGRGLAFGQVRVLGRPEPARQRVRLLEQRALGVEVQQEGSELLAHPQGAVVGARHRLDVEVGPGEEPLVRVPADDVDVEHPVRVVVRDVVEHLDLARAASLPAGVPVGLHQIAAEEEVGGVALAAEAVVRLGPERAVPVVDHRGEAGDHLPVPRALAAVRGRGVGAGRRSVGEEVRGQRRAALEGGDEVGRDGARPFAAVPPVMAVPVVGAAAGDRGARGGEHDRGGGPGRHGAEDQ